MKNKKKLVGYICNLYKKKVPCKCRRNLKRKLKRNSLFWKKKILKRDNTIEKLRNNNRELASQLTAVKSENKKLTDEFLMDDKKKMEQRNVMELKEKLTFYEKKLTMLNDSMRQKIFPSFMACTEEFGRNKMILNECITKMNNSAKILGSDQCVIVPRNNYNSNKINQVVPMVKGFSIHKPIISLKRFQLNSSQRILSPIEEIPGTSMRPRSRLGKNRALSDVIFVQRSPVATTSANVDAVLSPIPDVNPVVRSNESLGNEIVNTLASTNLFSSSQLANTAVPYVSIENMIIDGNNGNDEESNDNGDDDDDDDDDDNYYTNKCKKRKNGLVPDCEKRRRVDNDDPLEGTSWMYCDVPNDKIKSDKNGNKNNVPLAHSNTKYESFPLPFVTIRKKHISPNGFVRIPSSNSGVEELVQNCEVPENACNRDDVDANGDFRQINSIEKNLNCQTSCQDNGTIDEQLIEEDDSSHKNESCGRTKEIIKPCFVPIGSVPVPNGGSGTPVSSEVSNRSEGGLKYHSPYSVNVSNVVVSLERTDELKNCKKGVGKKSSGLVGVTGGSKRKTKGRNTKNNTSVDETAKENLPNSSINSDKHSGINGTGNNSYKRFLSIADSNRLSESRHENSSLFGSSSEYLSMTEDKRSLRTRGKIKNYKEPDMRSKKRRD